MRKHILAAGIAAAAFLPSMALAQETCPQQRDSRVAGTVVGAGVGALLGSAVAGRDDRGKGAVVGGIGGAIIGNQIAKSKADCARAYGYYDSNGAWHATAVPRSDASGYYARDGAWVDGAPNGYYDASGRWVAASNSASGGGYYTESGAWVPASASGYYDADGRWVAGAATGYYDNGRWVAGPATGRYDASGRWIRGQASGHRDSNGVWVADAQPGHYDSDGRWRPGPTVGYYDSQGRWIETARSADRQGANASYEYRSVWMGAPRDTRGREAWMDRRIRQAMNDGSLDRDEASEALRTLNEIRRQDTRLSRANGRLNRRDEAMIQARLERLASDLGWIRQDDRRSY